MSDFRVLSDSEAVVWCWDAGAEYPLGFVASDGHEFERRMAAISEGHCPRCAELHCGHGDRLDRGWRHRAPIGEEDIEWARCGCLSLWCITYEEAWTIAERYRPMLVPF
jgi:hypothetical protein